MSEPYLIPVKDTLYTAWDKVYGNKKTIWTAFTILFAIMFALGFAEGIAEAFLPDSLAMYPIKLIVNVIGYFLQMGTLYIGVKCALDTPINYKMLFSAFHMQIAIKITVLYLMQVVLFIPVFILVFIGGFISALYPVDAFIPAIALYAISIGLLIYIAVRMQLSMAFVLVRHTKPWDAIKLSFKCTRDNVWQLIALLFAQLGLVVVSAIPLGIGLIWSLPFTLICYGIIYKRLLVNAE